MQVHTHTHTLRCGRELAWAAYGDASGLPLLYLNGAGSSRLEPAYADGYARRTGLRIVAVDRPGFGGSDASASPGFAAFADDLIELADALKLGPFGVAGMSAGGPHALHLAARSPERVRSVALINASADSQHPAWRATPVLMRMLASTAACPPVLPRVLSGLKSDPAGFCARAARREGWSRALTAQFVAAVTEGMRQQESEHALLEEARRVLCRPWDLPWEKLACPVLAFCGARDPGRWFYLEQSKRLPNLRFVPVAGGHQPIMEEQVWEHMARALSAQAQP